jgi:putative transposase
VAATDGRVAAMSSETSRQREVITTVRLKLHSLTNRKAELLEREYQAFQAALRGETSNLHSVTNQQVTKIEKQRAPRHEQPLTLRNDAIAISKNDLPLSKYWIRLPIYNPAQERGDSVWCPVFVPEKDEGRIQKADIGDSELVRRDGDWYVHLTCKRTYDLQDSYSDVLAIDMGARWIAVSVALADRATTFYGKEVRRIREHYKQLGKRLGNENVKRWSQIVGRIYRNESRKVEDRLHKISRKIVDEAENRDAVIVIGDLSGIREDNDKGRFVNDKIHTMPFAKLKSFIEYKAYQAGLEVISVDEAYTSQTCNRCAEKGTRETQGRFRCPHCGLDDNADKNGALNIGKRALGKFQRPLSEAGAVLARPETQVLVNYDGVQPANSSESVTLTLSEDS